MAWDFFRVFRVFRGLGILFPLTGNRKMSLLFPMTNIQRLYIATLSFLIVHQIDAAYWNEWELFLLPGGIQLFNILNLAIIPFLVYGFRSVILKETSGRRWSLITGGLGTLTLLIHSGFYIAGNDRFTLPISALIVVACGLSGIAKVVLTLKRE